MKRFRDLDTGRWSEPLARYVRDLEAYLGERDIPLIDFTGEPRIRKEHYANGDHLDPAIGAPVFTELLAERLAPYLPAR
ncbi:hypothetical protein D3C83_184480 [compost metagenome]